MICRRSSLLSSEGFLLPWAALTCSRAFCSSRLMRASCWGVSSAARAAWARSATARASQRMRSIICGLLSRPRSLAHRQVGADQLPVPELQRGAVGALLGADPVDAPAQALARGGEAVVVDDGAHEPRRRAGERILAEQAQHLGRDPQQPP